MKSAATYLLLLFGTVMLCFSIFSEISTAAETERPLYAGTPNETLVPEQQKLPVAWLEQSTEHSAAADYHKVTLMLLHGLRRTYNTSFILKARLVRLNRSFTSVSTRFRILPNAP